MKLTTLNFIERVRVTRAGQTTQMISDVVKNKPIEFEKEEAQVIIRSYVNLVNTLKETLHMIDYGELKELPGDFVESVDYGLSNMLLNAKFAQGLI